MPRSLSPNRDGDQWELPGDPHTRKLRFARSIAVCTYGRRGAIAARLQRSASLLEAYADPERENVPPNQRLAEIMEAAIAEGVPPRDALEPLTHLCSVFGVEITERLPVVGTIGVEPALAGALRDCTEAFAEVVKSIPGGLTGFEAGRCRKELREARIALDQLEADIDAAVAAGGGAR